LAVRISREVYNGIEHVRKSGAVNMLSRTGVINLCSKAKFYEAADWVHNNRSCYARLIFTGIVVVEDPEDMDTDIKEAEKQKEGKGE